MYLVRPPYILRKIYPKTTWRKNPEAKKIYLTFDDGPVTEVTTGVLDVLKKEDIKATFFCVGENVMKYPDIYQRIIDEQHKTGNHTFNHLNGWNTNTRDYIQNIEKCAAFVKSNLFRPPYGRLKKTQYSLLNNNYSIIMWDVLSGDYDKATTPEQCLKNVIDYYRNGSVIVFHDSYKAQNNLEYALPRFIEHAKMNGFEFDVL